MIKSLHCSSLVFQVEGLTSKVWHSIVRPKVLQSHIIETAVGQFTDPSLFRLS